MCIHVYSLHPKCDSSQPPFARLVRRPLTQVDGSVQPTDLSPNLCDYKHFSYIHNLSLYAHSYDCARCSKLFTSSKGLSNHLKSCIHNTKHTYKGGVFHPKPNCFQELEEWGVAIPDELKFTSYTCVYDSESLLVPLKADGNCHDSHNVPPHPPTTTTTTSSPDYTLAFSSSTASSSFLVYTHRHVPISVALYSDVPGFENPVCLVGNGEPQSLINDMMTYLDKMADAVC